MSATAAPQEEAAAVAADIAGGPPPAPPAGDAIVYEAIQRPAASSFVIGVDKPATSMMAFMPSVKPGEFTLAKITIEEVEQIAASHITGGDTFEPIMRATERMVQVDGVAQDIKWSMWKRAGEIWQIWIMDYCTWNGAFVPYWDGASKTIKFKPYTSNMDRGGLEYSRHYLNQNSMNWKCAINAKECGFDKVMFVQRQSHPEQAGSRSEPGYVSQYIYMVEQSTKRLYQPPLYNIFDDGRICMSPQVSRGAFGPRGLNDVFIDLEESPGNLDVSKTMTGMTAEVRIADEGDLAPYLHIVFPKTIARTVTATLPPIWD
jgi:hypothetical protein